MSVPTEAIRNIAIAGHGTTGKTSLLERILARTGQISRAETVESGKTVSDFSEDEVKHQFSIHTALAHTTWNDKKINLLDTPGSGDFVGEVVTAFRAAESTLLLIGARSGVQIETIKLWRRLNERGMPRIAFVNKMDEERADFGAVIDDLRERFELPVVPVTIPMGAGSDFKGVINLIEMKAYLADGDGETAVDIPEEYRDQAEEYHEAMIENAALGDDELTEKYLEEETLSIDEARKGLTEGLRDNRVVPVLCGSALNGLGIDSLLNFMANAAPSPAGLSETATTADGEEIAKLFSSDGAFSAFVFKTSVDQFSGRLGFIKVVTGTLATDTEFVNPRTNKKDKTGKVFLRQGKRVDETGSVVAGDIAVLAKLTGVDTNDTLCAPGESFTYKPLALPSPVHSVAVHAASRKDEDKMAQALQRILEEDKTLQIQFNEETKQTVLSGMGEFHINLILQGLRDHQKVTVETETPKVAYRETITKKADATFRHKKQTGGHGQFAEVSISVRPLDRGEQYQFDNAIRGMAVSKGYIPGIEKGFHEAMETGFIAGYPAVDIGVTLNDGKEHPVDSSEMAFKLASRGAMRDAVSKAGPILLEPIMSVSIFVEEQYLGDILSDVSGRRGRVMGQQQLGGGIAQIDAEIPHSEMLRYAIDLRSITSGTGSYEMEFARYDPVTGKIADEIIAAAKREEENE